MSIQVIESNDSLHYNSNVSTFILHYNGWFDVDNTTYLQDMMKSFDDKTKELLPDQEFIINIVKFDVIPVSSTYYTHLFVYGTCMVHKK